MNPKILILAATSAEIKPFLDHFTLAPNKFIEHAEFDVLISGVGAWATAFSLAKYIQKHYMLILNVGIAGSFDRNLQLGSVCVISQDCFADFGAESPTEFLTAEKLGLGINHYSTTIPQNFIPFLNNLPKVSGITVQKAHGKTESISFIQSYFPAQTESMEGAAVFFSAQELNIPALQVRSISNFVEPRNKANWDIPLALQNLNKWLINFITDINEIKMTN
ncbi:MAG: futalosine hydrolase [Pedobacter sp.]|nr:MAG: futalosine hydrolase [Pedobacter sp.]